MPNLRRPALVASVALALLIVSARPAAADGERVTIEDVNVSSFPFVTVTASASDASGRPLRGLGPQDVQVLEEGFPRAAEIELSARTAPVALAIVLDTSGSMAGVAFADAQRAVIAMLDTLRPIDTATLVTFSTQAILAHELSGDRASLARATREAVASGNTAIYDALTLAIEVLGRADPQASRTIVLLTDGVDNASGTSRDAVRARIAGLGYPTYIIGLGGELDEVGLVDLAGASRGGQYLRAPTSAQLASTFGALSEQIMSRYAITFRSGQADAPDGALVSLDVRLVRGGSTLARSSSSFVRPPRPAVARPTAGPAGASATAVVVADNSRGAALAAATASASVLLLGGWGYVRWRAFAAGRRSRRRVTSFVATLSDAERAPARPFSERVVRPLLTTIGRPLLRFAPGSSLESARRQLTHAGEPLGIGPVEFLGIRLGATAAGAAAGLLLFALDRSLLGASFVLAGAAAGLSLPALLLGMAVRARQRAILVVLPSALDILAVSLEAGVAFDGAVAHVARTFHEPLAGEFRRLLVEFQIGRVRADTMRDMAARIGLPEFTRFVEAIIQAETLGVSYSRVIVEQASEMRTRRRQRAEESARVAPVKMIIPMVVFIFPALFIVLLGPAVPRLVDVFSGGAR